MGARASESAACARSRLTARALLARAPRVSLPRRSETRAARASPDPGVGAGPGPLLKLETARYAMPCRAPSAPTCRAPRGQARARAGPAPDGLHALYQSVIFFFKLRFPFLLLFFDVALPLPLTLLLLGGPFLQHGPSTRLAQARHAAGSRPAVQTVAPRARRPLIYRGARCPARRGPSAQTAARPSRR